MKALTQARGRLVILVAVLGALVSAGGLSWAFSEQIAHSRELRVEELEVQHELEAARAYYAMLVELQQKVETDQFVIDWARRNLVWAQQGETMVVFVDPQPAAEVPSRPVAEEIVLEEKPLWVEVWELIAGR